MNQVRPGSRTIGREMAWPVHPRVNCLKLYIYTCNYSNCEVVLKHIRLLSWLCKNIYKEDGEEDDKKLGSAYCLCPSCPWEWHHLCYVAHPSCWIHPEHDPSHAAAAQGGFSKRQGLIPSQETLLFLCPGGKVKGIFSQNAGQPLEQKQTNLKPKHCSLYRHFSCCMKVWNHTWRCLS